MTNLRRLAIASTVAGLLALAAFLPFGSGARAQVPSNPAPYNVDLGALITNTLRTAGTVTTNPQANTNWRGVVCTLSNTASSGSPSVTFKIQGYDAATATYLDYLTSSAIGAYPATTAGVANVLIVYPAVQTSSLPANTAAISMHLPRTWRVSQTIAEGTGGSGKSPALTGKIGCNYLL